MMRGIELISPCCNTKDEYQTVSGIHICSSCNSEFTIFTESWDNTPKVMRLKISRDSDE